jgi:hypothetical protein
MAYRHGTDCDVVAAQEAMLRLAERDYQLTIKRLEAETGISAVTLRTYKRDTMMPLSAFVKLSRVIPDDLTSLVMEHAGKHIGTNEPSDGDIDALGIEAARYVSEKLEADADGIRTPAEKSRLKDRARRVASVALAVAA